MDPVFLARLQFGFTAGFHFLFPPTTFGLTLIILILESFDLKARKETVRDLSDFLIKVLGVVFVMGAATGIALEFAFGNNWASYSRAVGDIFGAPLAAEGIFAFFLESVFLGILLFGRKRVSRRTYWWSAFFVFLGAHLSGLWILIANSWMQTPAGFAWRGGRAVLTDFFQAALNHSTVVRFIHTVLGGWITGSLLVSAVAAWWMLKGLRPARALSLLKVSLGVFILAAFVQVFSGHLHSVQVARTQPQKMAAFEALWRGQEGAPFTVFGIPDAKKEKVYLQVRIPMLLSYLVSFNVHGLVKGLDEFPKDDRPPVFIPFSSYHLMILFGLIFFAQSIAGGIMVLRGKGPPRWYLRSLILAVPLPFLANELGWVAAEVGRQPWAVFEVLRTSDAVSRVVPAGNIVLSLALFVLIYAIIGLAGVRILARLIRKGPEDPAGIAGPEPR
jgi:cytochrome d ubiquinol oxidase subunit I